MYKKTTTIIAVFLMAIMSITFIANAKSECACVSGSTPKIILSSPSDLELYGVRIKLQWKYYETGVIPTGACVLNFSLYANFETAIFEENASVVDLPTIYYYAVPSDYEINTNITFAFVMYFNVSGIVSNYARAFNFLWRGEATPTPDYTNVWILVGILTAAAIAVVIIIYSQKKGKETKEKELVNRELIENRVRRELTQSPTLLQQQQPDIYTTNTLQQKQYIPAISTIPPVVVSQTLEPVKMTQSLSSKKIIKKNDIMPSQCLNENALFNDSYCVAEYKRIYGKTPQDAFGKESKPTIKREKV